MRACRSHGPGPVPLPARRCQASSRPCPAPPILLCFPFIFLSYSCHHISVLFPTNRWTCDALLKYGPQSNLPRTGVTPIDERSTNQRMSCCRSSRGSRRAVLVAQAKRFVLMQDRSGSSHRCSSPLTAGLEEKPVNSIEQL